MIRLGALIAVVVAVAACGSPSRVTEAPSPDSGAASAKTTGPTKRVRSKDSPLAALESAAGLDSRLKRAIERWDEQVEAGLRVQAAAKLAGPDALERLLATLRSRPEPTPVDDYLIGRLEGKLGRIGAAKQAFRRALKRDSRFLWAHEGLAICSGQVAQADARERTGGFADPAAVQAELERAFKIWPEFPRGWLVLGQLHLQRLDPKRSLDALTRIPEKHPAYRDGVLTKARCHMMLRRPENAVTALRSVLPKEPDNVEWLAQLGSALLELRDVKGARDAFERAAKLAPKHAPSRLGLARTDEIAGRGAAAKRAYESLSRDASVSAEIRRDAIDGLARVETGARPQISLATLLVTLRDNPDAAKRREAASVLWRVPDEAVLRVFLQRVHPRVEADERVRVYAVRALATHALPSVVEVLVGLIDPAIEPSKLVRGIAVRSLGRLPAQIAPLDAMARSLTDPESYVFEQARAALEQSTQHRVLPGRRGDLDANARSEIAAAWRAWIKKNAPAGR